jgi:alcohol dehydrogenase, propanol-preferring
MRAYRMVEWQQPPRVVEVPTPEPGPGQVLVRVAGVGLCHSDIGMMSMPSQFGEALDWRMPFTLGHETAGYVESVGDSVTEYSVGDAVALISPASCGKCEYCLRGFDSACPNAPAGRGYGRDGGLAEFILVEDVRSMMGLGDLDPRTAGPLTDAGVTSYHAVRRALPRVRPGGTVVVIGAGGLGAFAVQYLRILSGAQVVAVDINPDRLRLAAELGAHVTTPDVGEVRALTDGSGADAVLDFVGIDATITAGLKATRWTGAYGLIGAANGKVDAAWMSALPRDGEVFTFQGSSIADLHDVLKLARQGLIRNEVETFSFDDVEGAYTKLHDGTLSSRAVVTFD